MLAITPFEGQNLMLSVPLTPQSWPLVKPEAFHALFPDLDLPLALAPAIQSRPSLVILAPNVPPRGPV